MVLVNNILSKGFDGGNLISGLACHVRNVLMARDETTLPLLETSEQQRKSIMSRPKSARFNIYIKR